MIISDHGFSDLKSMIHIVNFLLQEGYMVFKEKAKIKKGISTTKIKEYIIKIGGENLLNFIKRNNFIKKILFKALPVGKYSYFGAIDWGRSSISYAEGSGGIAYFNPKLKANEQKLGDLFTELREKALKLKTPDGSKVFKDVYLSEKLYSQDGPDIIFRVNKGYCADGFDRQDRSVFGKNKSGYIGMHDEDGIVAIYGQEIKKGQYIAKAGVCDILPTILALLGKQIPTYFDGKPLGGISTKGLKYRSIEVAKEKFFSGEDFSGGYSEGENEQIKENLKNLGYL
tara:strand:- start:175 stop:1026 length:852 start_codon:yes stop_codon:yes gene_type:complete